MRICIFPDIFAKIHSMSKQTNTEEITVFVTVTNEDEAAIIARAVVEAKLAACANITGNIRSIYSWQGKVEDDSEVLMILKTRQDLFEELSEKIKELHSYDVPEIIALPIIMGSKDYLTWIKDSTK